MKVRARQTPVSVMSGPSTVFHVVPHDAFTAGPRIDPNAFIRQNRELPILNHRTSSGPNRPNLDGVISSKTFARGDQPALYTQLFRSGAIEAVDTFSYNRDDEDLYVPVTAIKDDIEYALPKYLGLLEEEGIAPPVYVFMSILDAEGYRYPSGPGDFTDYPKLNRNMANFPEVVIDEYPDDVKGIVNDFEGFILNTLGVVHSDES